MSERPRRDAMRERIDAALRSIPDIEPTDEDFEEADLPNPWVPPLLLSGWVLIAEFVDGEGDSAIITVRSPGLSYPATVGLLTIAHERA